MKKTLILIVGRTNAGKNTIVNATAKQYHIPVIKPLTDCPKMESGMDKERFRFVSEDKMTWILDTQEILAYSKTENPKSHKEGYRRCIAKADIDKTDSDILFYIARPDEVKYMKEHYQDEYNYIVVSVMASEELRRERSIKKEDAGFEERTADENEEFNFFESNLRNMDEKIINDKEVTESMKQMGKIVRNEIIAQQISAALD